MYQGSCCLFILNIISKRYLQPWGYKGNMELNKEDIVPLTPAAQITAPPILQDGSSQQAEDAFGLAVWLGRGLSSV
ncbi:hypothetical protein AT5G50665 [Arabidopsis thaliana]|jgi:hypothetical protein|nr:uncharacterized protein AT5G50565 [Arabidopsis thaliana]NP_001330583.1 uncharacterized protein AT5G50565 [Arabidopsis thaliana]NP_001330814.1 uncharacterized protein AT5G50665 [Arabidopsis thaliana]NP_001330815.1 uncharacterized protein AT5G50665 [Arabidopsis thaliana]NP_199868.4 uncharacterized protein AT5G50565 [Arabidopsis thaliana]NP_680416.4 uncharacterized protein AT5G50665 [Arabidopsis thaliana]AAT71977.1 At5g50665 [Arabidopsis thaliana]ABE66236.1 hypothetical protein At5g50565 [Ar|eukprot:NP_001190505.1 hypothetical protein AT5G50565 [Arabidopsis thaliana]